MAWRFVLCELPTTALAGKVIGEINNAYDRQVSLGLNGADSASFKIRMDNPIAHQITDREGDVMLKVYKDSTLKFIGDYVPGEESGEDNDQVTLSCTFQGPLWRLSKRLTGTSATGEGDSPSGARGGLLQTLLTTANGQGDTGIRTGTIASLYSGNAAWAFKPVDEAFKEMANSVAPPPFEAVSVKTMEDTFAGTPATALAGRTSTGAAGGQTWNSAGAATDWVIDAGGTYLQRVVGTDSGDGRHGLLGPSYPSAAVLAEQTIFRDGTMGSPATLMGLLVRYVNASNYLRYTVTTELAGSQTFRITKMIGGTPTDLFVSSFGTILDPVPFAGGMRIVVDATGRYAVWWWPTTDLSYQAVPIMIGQDDDLAAGGPIDGATNPGSCGIYNYTGGSGSPVQGYENFFTATPAVTLDSQALEFELAPSEPTADSGASGVVGAGVKIASLNVDDRLGTDRANVIFEYGGGSRTIKAYKRTISRDALMTRGFSLPSDPTPWPAGALVTRQNNEAILDRGLYEDVIQTDVGAERAAVVDLHLLLRKQAREEITFEPTANAAVFGTDYFVGDTVTARAIYAGTVRFNATFRVRGADISIDDQGKETVSLKLTAD